MTKKVTPISATFFLAHLHLRTCPAHVALSPTASLPSGPRLSADHQEGETPDSFLT